MKGVIVIAVKELVVKKFGAHKWKEALKQAGIEKEPLIMSVSDVDDEVVLKVMEGLCKTLNLNFHELSDAFGDFWVNTFALKTLPHYFRGIKTAKDFLLAMDNVHVSATKSIPNNHPPRFTYEWKNEKTLIMIYRSKRGLIDLMPGLVRGVGRYFNERIAVTKLDKDKIQIVFSS
jgi:hypothetical protein